MAFNFFDKVGRSKNKDKEKNIDREKDNEKDKDEDFSDEKIDKFVRYLKAGVDPDTEEDDDFDYENAELPDELDISDASSMRFLWNRYNEKSMLPEFTPLEYIRIPVLETHRNMCRHNPNLDIDDLDPNEKELCKFIKELQKVSLKTCERIAKEDTIADSKSSDKLTPVDASAVLTLTKNKIRAWIYIVPPRNGGKDITADKIHEILKSNNVTHGIVKGLPEKIVKEKLYFKIIEIAKGSDPVNGHNGSVEELFSREKSINIKEDASGNVNYKELNLIRSVKSGDVICNITLPTKSVSGRAVDGSVVYGVDGKFPDVPKGENTSYSEDGTLLVADIGGEVVFEGGCFHVRRLLIIENDVDNAVGNIDFTGDVLIKGGVREGFSVKADGNIRVEGTVEGAEIIAGGDISITRGMTGGNKGYMEAGGTIECKFLENCRVYAKGNIKVQQMMYSEIASDDSVIMTGGKGSAIGGKIIAGQLIEATSIGSRANSFLKTQIVLGITPNMIKEEKSLSQRLEEIEETILKLEQNIKYIEKNIENATQERLDMLEEFKAQLQVRNFQKESTANFLEELEQKMVNNSETCNLKCGTLYPIVIVNISGSNYVVDDELVECKIFRKDGKSYIKSSSLGKIVSF